MRRKKEKKVKIVLKKRLDDQQWQQAQADYEIRNSTFSEIANRFNTAVSTISRKAKTDDWERGKMQKFVEKKINAIKSLAEVKSQMQNFSQPFQHTFESVVQERLQAEGLLASLDVAILDKSILFAQQATSVDEIETLSRVRKNLSQQQQATHQTNVTVSNQTQNAVVADNVALSVVPKPDQILRAVLRGELSGDDT